MPQDYATKCAAMINGHKTLQQDLICEYCDMTETDEEWLRGEYENLGYELVNQKWDVPETAHIAIKKEIDDYIMPYLKSRFLYREEN